ncbi:MAG: MBL fold metallo-hydrolase [Gemmatimonadota bacterium]
MRPDIVCIPNGVFAENCYLISPAGSSEAVIVDPGDEAERFLEEAETRGLTIREIWLTHAHIDHITGVGRVKAATAAPIFLHPADRELYDNLVQQASWFGLEVEPAPPPDRALAHGQTLTFGPLAFAVRHTPGHSLGSVCFVGEGIVIGGDVLFQGSIGRTDLPGGSLPQLLTSIRTELLVLPEPTIVYPGHGPDTTIGVERRTNPFLQAVETAPPAR